MNDKLTNSLVVVDCKVPHPTWVSKEKRNKEENYIHVLLFYLFI